MWTLALTFLRCVSPALQKQRGRFRVLVATGPDWLGGVNIVPAEGKPLSRFGNSTAIVLRLSPDNAHTDSTQTDTPPCPFTFSDHKGSCCWDTGAFCRLEKSHGKQALSIWLNRKKKNPKSHHEVNLTDKIQLS